MVICAQISPEIFPNLWSQYSFSHCTVLFCVSGYRQSHLDKHRDAENKVDKHAFQIVGL